MGSRSAGDDVGRGGDQVNDQNNNQKTSPSIDTVTKFETEVKPGFSLDEPASAVILTEVSHSSMSETRTMSQRIEGIFSPVSSGLIIVSTCCSTIRYFVVDALLREVLGCCQNIDISLPVNYSKVYSLVNGDDKAYAIHEAFSYRAVVSRVVDYEAVHCSKHHSFVWSSCEGRKALQMIVPEARSSIVIMVQEHAGSISPEMASNLKKIDDWAKQTGACILLVFVSSDRRYRNTDLSEYCSEHVSVDICEPAIGYKYAFSFDPLVNRQLDCFGIRKIMCSVNVIHNELDYHYEPFISANLDDRTIWMMRASGMTYEQIGLSLKKNKSTVLRRLQSIKAPSPKEYEPFWIEAGSAARISEADNSC